MSQTKIMTRREENLPISKTFVCVSSDPYDSISTKCNMVGLRRKKMYEKGYDFSFLYST
jgi:hypothetical protein